MEHPTQQIQIHQIQQNPLNITERFIDKSQEEIKEILKRESYPCIICALNIHGELNIGNMMRTVNLCGLEMVICGRRKFDKRSAVGAQFYTPYDRLYCVRDSDSTLVSELTSYDYILDEEIFYNYVIENNIIPVFVEQDEKSIPLTNRNIKMIINEAKKTDKKPMFIFGNESIGIPRNILALRERFEKSYTIELKQRGCIQSFNVSNCCAILSYKIMECYEEL
jgi:tRNA G18 (ribose-2'-O)-methylase SpoU